jgi:CubicO group peptidase (beta-lactamase class C family)
MTDTIKTSPSGTVSADGGPLPRSEPEALGLDPTRLEQLYGLIERHVAEGRYPGAQVALARRGRLAALRTFGQARLAPEPVGATDQTLWLLYSQTKMIVAAAVWQLVDRGAVSFADRIADHVPEFARHGKGEITLHQLLTHQGGFPTAQVGMEAWRDRELRRALVCDFTLDWTPGTNVQYHAGSAFSVAAVLIEAVTGRDFREVIRRDLLDPVGLSDVHVGVPAALHPRCAHMHVPEDGQQVGLAENNTDEHFEAGRPSGGGYATAAGMAAFYQVLAAGGALNGVRVLSPRVVRYATRNHTEGRVDGATGLSMNRGLGPSVRGSVAAGAQIRGLGTIAPPGTFGHGGAGSSYSWADPESGLSFSYLSNARLEDPFHSQRLDRLSSLAHAALLEP